MGRGVRHGSRRSALAQRARTSSAISGDAVERAAAEIRHVSRVRTLELALDIGEIVFRNIFRGDVELLRRNGPKDVSFRQLAERADLGISSSSLWRSVAIYELSLRFPVLRKSEHLGVSHVRAVLGLPPDVQAQLLARAESEELAVAALVNEAASSRRGQGGRPPKLEVLRAIDTLMRVTALPLSAFADDRATTKLSAEDIECAREMLRDLDERVSRLRELLRKAERRR